MLLKRQLALMPFPKVFELNVAEEIDDKLIAVMMPFDSEFDAVYACIQDVAKQLNMRCQRADDFWKSQAVVQDIVSLINKSRIVVCDFSGRNANVMYETGIAHTVGRDVIIIYQLGSGLPFNIGHLRGIEYWNSDELADRLRQAMQSIYTMTRREVIRATDHSLDKHVVAEGAA